MPPSVTRSQPRAEYLRIIMPPDHCSQHTLEHSLARTSCLPPPASSSHARPRQPGCRVATLARPCSASQCHNVEDDLDVCGSGQVLVLDVVALVQQVNVDGVGVVGGADGRDSLESVARFAPGAAGHAVVEGGEEGEVGVFDGGGARGDGA